MSREAISQEVERFVQSEITSNKVSQGCEVYELPLAASHRQVGPYSAANRGAGDGVLQDVLSLLHASEAGTFCSAVSRLYAVSCSTIARHLLGSPFLQSSVLQ